MSRAYRQLRWIAVLLTIFAAIAVILAILIAAFDFDIHWTNQDWSAFGTIVGALMTLVAVVVALAQTSETQKAAAREQQEVRAREELAAVEAIARTATAFSSKVDAIAEELLQHEQYSELTAEAHEREFGPDAEATVADIRASFAETQRIIQRRQDAVLAAHEAQTTISLAITRTHTPLIQMRSKRVLGEVVLMAERLDPPSGVTDWEGAQRHAPRVSAQVAFLLRDSAAPQGLTLRVEVASAQATPAAEDQTPT
ncbi:hypothetical protein GS496_14220 [Rhodococcus hoagii]|nr:hypothetical protein [Prescottella equi]